MKDSNEVINSECIEIKLSKVKLILMFLGSILFIIGGILFIRNPTEYESFIMKSPVIIFIAGCVSVLFFGVVGIFLFKKLGDKSPGLIISEEGITDNSSAVSAGFIPWTDVKAIKETKVVNQKFINIVVKNPHVYIDRQKSAFKKKAMRANYNIYGGTPIGISVNGLKSNYKDLKALLEKRMSDFKSR